MRNYNPYKPKEEKEKEEKTEEKDWKELYLVIKKIINESIKFDVPYRKEKQ